MLWMRRTPKVEQQQVPRRFSKRYLFEPQYRNDIFNTLNGLIRKYSNASGNGVIIDPIDGFLYNKEDENDNLRRLLQTVDRKKLEWKEKAVFWSTWNYINENRVPNARKGVKWRVRNARHWR